MIDGNFVPSDEQFERAFTACEYVTFGDGSGKHVATATVATAAGCSYGRARHWLERNRTRHASGSDHWRRNEASDG